MVYNMMGFMFKDVNFWAKYVTKNPNFYKKLNETLKIRKVNYGLFAEYEMIFFEQYKKIAENTPYHQKNLKKVNGNI